MRHAPWTLEIEHRNEHCLDIKAQNKDLSYQFNAQNDSIRCVKPTTSQFRMKAMIHRHGTPNTSYDMLPNYTN